DGGTVAAGGGRLAELIDTGSGHITTKLTGPRGAMYGVAFSREGSTLAAAGADRTVHLWGLPVKSWAGLPIAEEFAAVNGVAVSPDDRTAAAVGRQGKHGFVSFVDIAGGVSRPLLGPTSRV